MQCWLDMIKNIENTLQEQCEFSKNQDIDTLIENISTVENYLHYYFKYNLSTESRCGSHCCKFACSIPEKDEPLFHAPCDLEHTERCMYCDLYPQCIDETKKLIDFVQPFTDKIDKIICEEYKHDLKMIEKSVENFKNQQKRDYLQSLEWQSKFDEKRPDRAYVTMDFQMKIIPRKSDEAQVLTCHSDRILKNFNKQSILLSNLIVYHPE